MIGPARNSNNDHRSLKTCILFSTSVLWLSAYHFFWGGGGGYEYCKIHCVECQISSNQKTNGRLHHLMVVYYGEITIKQFFKNEHGWKSGPKSFYNILGHYVTSGAPKFHNVNIILTRFIYSCFLKPTAWIEIQMQCIIFLDFNPIHSNLIIAF